MFTMYKERDFWADLPKVVQRIKPLCVKSISCAPCCFPTKRAKILAQELGVPFLSGQADRNTLEIRLSVTSTDVVHHSNVFAFYASSGRMQHLRAFYKIYDRPIPFME